MTQSPTLPPTVGIGLKPQHYSDVLRNDGDARLPGWLEVHPQNYFAPGGPPRRWLAAMAERYALSFHSTGLSLGSAEGPNQHELDQFADLCAAIMPASISDHVSWSMAGNDNFPDLLPIPYTSETLDVMARSVETVQERLGQTMLVENPSRYLAFAEDEMEEGEFLDRLCRKAGCGLIFDINNVAVSANNVGLDAEKMIDGIDPALVGEVHLAGHASEDHGDFTLHIDDHGSEVDEETWSLYERFIKRAGAKPTLIEWDTDVPDYDVLMDEADRATAILQRATASSETPNARAA